MGKQGRRKQRNNRRDKDYGRNQQTETDGSSLSSSAVRQLRHPDVKVRMSGLVAVQTQTQIMTSTASRSGGGGSINWNVLHAVRELVGNESDLECAALAAEILGGYLQQQQQDKSPNAKSKFRETTAGWAIVLLGRLEQARKSLEEIQTTLMSPAHAGEANAADANINEQNDADEIMEQVEERKSAVPAAAADNDSSKKRKKGKKNKISDGGCGGGRGSSDPIFGEGTNNNKAKQLETHQKQWMGLIVPTMKALTILIESNDLALEQCIHLQKQSFVNVVLGLLSSSCNLLDANKRLKDLTLKTTLILADQCVIFASRCLHSALDDNEDLAETVIASTALGTKLSSISINRWEYWLGPADNSTKTESDIKTGGEEEHHPFFVLPVQARLHLLGCIVNLYQLTTLSGNHTTAASACSDYLLRYGFNFTSTRGYDGLLLLACQMRPDGSGLTKLHRAHETYVSASRLYRKQREDAKMEEEIVKKVEERKEPAREIARRQKLQQEKEEKERAEATAAMTVDESCANDKMNHDSSCQVKRGAICDREKDGYATMEQELQSYRDLCCPVQLSLEILANLLTCWTRHEDDMDEEIDTGSGDSERGPLFQAASHSVSLIDQVELLCNEHCRMWKREESHPDEIDINSPIHSELAEIIEKMAACLVNSFLCDMFTNDLQSRMWNVVTDSLHKILHHNRNGDDAIQQSISAVAVSIQGLTTILDLMKARFRVLSTSNLQTLQDDLMAILASSRYLFTYETKCHCVSIVAGVVGQNPKTHDVATVTRRFVQMLTTTTSLSHSGNISGGDGDQNYVQIEAAVLNAIMDLYGPDDFFPHIFNELQVLPAIQTCLARISLQKLDAVDPETLETFDNSQRFVEYKQELNKRNTVKQTNP